MGGNVITSVMFRSIVAMALLLVSACQLSSRLRVPFGLVLSERRLAAGLSQEGLADRSELHRTYVCQLERGLKAPSLAAMETIAGALRVAPHVLVRDAESMANAARRGERYRDSRRGSFGVENALTTRSQPHLDSRHWVTQ